MKYKKYHKVRHHCRYTGEYKGAAQSICNYHYHFIIKELAEEFNPNNAGFSRVVFSGGGGHISRRTNLILI